MEFWNNIINTALLGTDKKQLSNAELSADLNDAFEQIKLNNSLDKEDKFLQVTAVAFNYRQSGLSAIKKEELSIKEAEAETFSYCNKEALHVLNDILEIQSRSLLKFWLQHCEAKQRIVTPEIIPTLFEVAATQKNLQSLIVDCCGKRGEWLSSFNADWNFYTNENDEEIWQNGNIEQRKKLLQKIRTTEPAKAREWLQQTWQTEGANTKAELLKQLETNISDDDVEWLESLMNDKSQKVKDVVNELLKMIPTSSVITSYWNVLKNSIVLKKAKALLGIMNKTSLQIQLTNVDKRIFKTGIEKLSNTKEFSDEEFVIYQLMQFVPPQKWEEHFNATQEQIISYFLKDKSANKYLPVLMDATIRYKNYNWALSFLQNNDTNNNHLIQVLPEGEREKFMLRDFSSDADYLVQLSKKQHKEWSIELTRNIFKHTAKNIHQFNKIFYQEAIHLIPHAIVAELEKFTPQEQHLQSSWSNMSEYIMKLVSLKLQTILAFNLK